MKKKNEPVDTGPPELARHYTLKPVLQSQRTGNQTHIRIQDQTEIDRLLLNDWITPDQYSAAEAMARDIHIAGLVGLRAMDYGRVIGSATPPEITGREAWKRVKISKAIEYLDRTAGYDRRFLVMGVCNDELRLDKRAAGTCGEGLDRLIVFYAEWDR